MDINETTEPLDVERNCSGWILKGNKENYKIGSEVRFRSCEGADIMRPACPKFYIEGRQPGEVCMAPCYNKGIRIMCSEDYMKCATANPSACYTDKPGERAKPKANN